MAKKRNSPRPTGPSQRIVQADRSWSGSQDHQDDPTAPGDGIQKPPSPVALTDVDLDKLAGEFASEIEYQRSAQETFYQDLIKWNRIYRGYPKNQDKSYPLAHASNVVVKMAMIYSDQVIARIYQGLTQTQPSWVVSELNKKAAAVCKPYERFLDWSAQNMWNQREFLEPYVKDCVKLGTAIGYNDFVNEPVVRYNDQTRQTEIVGNRKGPRPTWVPREDFLIPIGFSDLQRSPWISHRAWFSWDLLEQMSYRGFIENLDALAGHGDEEDEVKTQRRRHEEQVVLQQPDNRFGLWSPEWVWFRRDLDRDGWPEEYVMLLHVKTHTILRLVANPSPSGRRPYFKSAFVSVQGEFDGIGIPEAVESLQEEASTIHNQRRDRAHLANIVMYIAKMAAGVPDTIRPKSGLVVKTPGGREDIQEFSPAIGQVSIDIAEENTVMSLGAQTVGMNDVDLSKISSPVGRAAATTIMALMQEGARRFDMNTTAIRGALTEQAHQITELWQVYGLPGPDETGSPEQVLDSDPNPNGSPSDAQLVRALLEQPASLRGLINIQLNASTAAINRETEKQSNIQLVGLVTQHTQQTLQSAAMIANPGMPPEMRMILVKAIKGQEALMEKLFQSFNAFDLDDVLASDIVEELFQRVSSQPPPMMMPGQPGQPGQAGPGGPGVPGNLGIGTPPPRSQKNPPGAPPPGPPNGGMPQ